MGSLERNFTAQLVVDVGVRKDRFHIGRAYSPIGLPRRLYQVRRDYI